MSLTNISAIGRSMDHYNNKDKQIGESIDSDRIGKKLEAPSNFSGPTNQRSCTDPLFTLLILMMWITMTVLGIYAWMKGDYRIILYPLDYDGNICGTNFGDIDMTEYPKFVYINSYGGGVCVKECPRVKNLLDTQTLVTYGGLYRGENATVPENFISIGNYSTADGVRYCDTNANNCPLDTTQSWASEAIRKGRGFAYYAVDTFEVLDVRCLSNPMALDKIKEKVYMGNTTILDVETLDKGLNIWGNLYGDLFLSRKYIFIFGLAVAVLFSFLYTFILRIKSVLTIIIWLSILSTISAVIGLGVFTLGKTKEWENEIFKTHSNHTILITKVLSYLLFGIGTLFLFMAIFLRKEIQLSVACVKEASRAIGRIPIILFLPFLQIIGFSFFLILWLFYAVHLASIGKVDMEELPFDNTVTVRTYVFDEFIQRSAWYLLFCLFWTWGFTTAMGDIIISMSIAKWYFTRDKKTINSGILCQSIRKSMYYHSGTAAFASLVLSLVQIIRAFVLKIQRKAKMMDNRIGDSLLCCCQCCLWCFHKFIEFLNKNAYIQTAIFGTGFIKSANASFSLILRNAKRIGAISYVSQVVLFLGKIFISVVTAVLAYYAMERYILVDNLIGPTFIILLFAYFIGDIFLDVFEMTISTILQCFLADEEMFEGDDRYAEETLREWLGSVKFEEKTLKL